jgi:hypothetical protein
MINDGFPNLASLGFETTPTVLSIRCSITFGSANSGSTRACELTHIPNQTLDTLPPVRQRNHPTPATPVSSEMDISQ